MAAAGNVTDRLLDELAAAECAHSVDHFIQVLGADQSLLDTRGEDRHGATLGWHPRGRVD